MSSSSHKKPARQPVKRRKVEFGQHTEDDDRTAAQTQSNLPSASGWSMRKIPTGHVQPLAVICAQVFARYFRNRLATREDGHWDAVKAWLAILPDTQVPRVFAALRSTCPTVLSNAHMTYFLRGASITLSDDLPGVNKNTLALIGQGPSKRTLRELHLVGLAKINDDTFAAVVAKLPVLQILDLRGCTKIGPKTVTSAGKYCPGLSSLNLNYTSVTPVSLAPLLKTCTGLEVLKLAGISGWTDAVVSKLWAVLDVSEFRLPNLKTLKLRQTAVTDASISQFLLVCPNIRRLDLSFTAVRHPPLLLTAQSLEKLSLTSTWITSSNLIQILSNMSGLRTLALGALGAGRGLSASISNSSALTMTDQVLKDITDILSSYESLEKVSLVGNSKLGMSGRKDGALADFIRRVGRRCTELNMASISSLRSLDLAGLVPDTAEDSPPPLKTLLLNNTNVDDNVGPFISSCVELQTLELSGTKITGAGLFPIIDACQSLGQLNLTSCRGIGVVDRRRFFEVWQEERKDN